MSVNLKCFWRAKLPKAINNVIFMNDWLEKYVKVEAVRENATQYRLWNLFNFSMM